MEVANSLVFTLKILVKLHLLLLNTSNTASISTLSLSLLTIVNPELRIETSTIAQQLYHFIECDKEDEDKSQSVRSKDFIKKCDLPVAVLVRLEIALYDQCGKYNNRIITHNKLRKMDYSRSVKSQKISKRSQEQPEQFEDLMHTPYKYVAKTASKSKNQSPEMEKIAVSRYQSPKVHSSEERNLLNEQVRIKGQAKLLYMKQCRQKKYGSDRIFESYPFSNMEAYVFNDQHLRGQNGELRGSVVQNQDGIHLVEQYKEKKAASKYKKEQDDQENTFNGLSISLFNDGTIYEGNYHDGKFCGIGYELHPNGNTYIGMFKGGVKNGLGAYYWFTTNQIYSGEWHGGLPHGYGTFNGKDKYEGNFSNGLKFGTGEEVFNNGDKYNGEYVNGVPQGYGQYFWPDGSVYRGDFKQGVRHGYGIWEDSKQIFQGMYRMDKKEGFGIYKWKKKQIYRGEFKQDFRDGYGEFYTIGKDKSQKLIYKGCWARGQKNEQNPADEQKIQQLYKFLNENDKIGKAIEENSKKSKDTRGRQRIGHRNCIPEPTNNTPNKDSKSKSRAKSKGRCH